MCNLWLKSLIMPFPCHKLNLVYVCAKKYPIPMCCKCKCIEINIINRAARSRRSKRRKIVTSFNLLCKRYQTQKLSYANKKSRFEHTNGKETLFRFLDNVAMYRSCGKTKPNVSWQGEFSNYVSSACFMRTLTTKWCLLTSSIDVSRSGILLIQAVISPTACCFWNMILDFCIILHSPRALYAV